MRRLVLLIAILFPELLFGFASWCKVYSLSSGRDVGYAGIDIGMGRFIISGYMSNASNAIILKLDSIGNVTSYKIYDFGYGYEYFDGAKFLPADNTIFAIGMAGPTSAERYAILMKIDTFLNTVWWVGERVAGSWFCCGSRYYADIFSDVAFINDTSVTSKIIAVGSAESCDCNEAEGKISIYNFDGTSVFRGLYILPSSTSYRNSGFRKVLKVAPNKFFAFGDGGWPSDSRIKILAFDTLGNVYWGREIDASVDFWLRSAHLTRDGNIVGVGTVSGNNGDIFVMRSDTAINVLWIYRIPLPAYDDAQDIVELPDGTFLITGYTASLGAGGYDGFLMKIDSLGNILWFKTYGGSGNDAFFDVQYTYDGGVLLVGYSESFSASRDIWVVKADTGGNTCSLCVPTSQTVSLSSIPVSRPGGYTVVSRSYQFVSTYSNPSASVTSNGCAPILGDEDLRLDEAKNICFGEGKIYDITGRSVKGIGRRGIYFIVSKGGVKKVIVR